MSRRPIRNSEDLIRVLLNRNSDVPTFAPLLGAGASATSGVKVAHEMIEDWRNNLFVASRAKESIADWLPKQPWFEDEDEYSLLFELTYDLPAQRRVFIEECVKHAHPTWGYVYLTSLLAHKVFTVVLTTNFDDLINEACYLYSENLRPMVAAHDSSIAAMRMSSDRPKIIKLHGDFLYDNIKNTLRELETLEANTKNKLTQIAQESGLVVAGYGGRDRSVMDVLEVLLRSDHYFPHGIYWCARTPYTINKRLEALLKRDRIHLVEIDGFDELMASVHGAAGFELPEPLAAPLKVAQDRARLFIDIPSDLKNHPVISRDMSCVLREMDRADVAHHIPPSLQAAIAESKGNIDAAIRLWSGELKAHPDDVKLIKQIANALIRRAQHNEAASIVKVAPDTWNEKAYMLLRARDFEGVVYFSNERLEKAPSDVYTRINRAIALKRWGRSDEMAKEIEVIRLLLATEKATIAIEAGLAALMDDRVGLLDALPKAILDGELLAEHFRDFPIFDEFRDDPEVRELAERLFREKNSASRERAEKLKNAIEADQGDRQDEKSLTEVPKPAQ